MQIWYGTDGRVKGLFKDLVSWWKSEGVWLMNWWTKLMNWWKSEGVWFYKLMKWWKMLMNWWKSEGVWLMNWWSFGNFDELMKKWNCVGWWIDELKKKDDEKRLPQTPTNTLNFLFGSELEESANDVLSHSTTLSLSLLY